MRKCKGHGELFQGCPECEIERLRKEVWKLQRDADEPPMLRTPVCNKPVKYKHLGLSWQRLCPKPKRHRGACWGGKAIKESVRHED
jgi:hypothetical protein